MPIQVFPKSALQTNQAYAIAGLIPFPGNAKHNPGGTGLALEKAGFEIGEVVMITVKNDSVVIE